MTVMPPELRIAVTVAFLGVGVFCLHRCAGIARSPSLADRVGYGAHALMSGSMVAMVWSPPRIIGWQMATFAVACGWFLVQATGVSVTSLRLTSVGAPVAARTVHGGHGRGGRARCLHHAVVMAAMVWMFATMTPAATTPTAMSMPGMPRSRSTGLIGVGSAGYCLLTAALLFVVYALTVVRGRSAGNVAARDDLVHAVMTAGTGAMLFAVT